VKGAEAALGSDVMNALMDGDALLRLLGPRREMAGRFGRSVSGTESAAPDKYGLERVSLRPAGGPKVPCRTLKKWSWQGFLLGARHSGRGA